MREEYGLLLSIPFTPVLHAVIELSHTYITLHHLRWNSVQPITKRAKKILLMMMLEIKLHIAKVEFTGFILELETRVQSVFFSDFSNWR